ncbi:MAG: hypothetical protein ACO1O1_02335 [Adhaeribacter sp.]
MKLSVLFVAIAAWAGSATSPAGSVVMKASQANPAGSGVYRSAADYKNGKLSLAVDCKTETHKIKLHTFRNKDYIDVIHQGKKHSMKKNEVYGLRDCEGINWRFAANKEYRIMEKGTLLIYQKNLQVPDPQRKAAGNKSQYFFSLGVEGPLQPLTLLNLKKATAKNYAFHDKLDAQFKSDGELAAYDSFHKQYKINHLLAQSTK